MPVFQFPVSETMGNPFLATFCPHKAKVNGVAFFYQNIMSEWIAYFFYNVITSSYSLSVWVVPPILFKLFSILSWYNKCIIKVMFRFSYYCIFSRDWHSHTLTLTHSHIDWLLFWCDPLILSILNRHLKAFADRMRCIEDCIWKAGQRLRKRSFSVTVE